jgi:hypothetical protein
MNAYCLTESHQERVKGRLDGWGLSDYPLCVLSPCSTKEVNDG